MQVPVAGSIASKFRHRYWAMESRFLTFAHSKGCSIKYDRPQKSTICKVSVAQLAWRGCKLKCPSHVKLIDSNTFVLLTPTPAKDRSELKHNSLISHFG